MDLAMPGIFTAGVLTFFTPCVLPLIPIYLSALVGSDLAEVKGTGRGQLLLRASLFSLGFVSVFSLLGLGAGSVGAFLSAHKAAVHLVGALIILLLGLKFLGVVRVPALDRIVRADDTRLSTRFGGVNAVVMGVVFAAGWSPCVGPVLGSVLTYTASQTAEPLTGLVYLTVYGAGFALPLLGVAAFAEVGVRFIQRTSQYLPVFERVVGGLLVVTSAWLVFDHAAAQLDGDGPAAPVASAPASDAPTSTAAVPTDPTVPGELPLMVEFYSSRCPVCERMEPVVDGLMHECNGKRVEIRQVDISHGDHRALAERFRLVGVPTFAFIDTSGTEVARLVGEQGEDSLRQAISALRGEPCPGVGRIDDIDDIDRLEHDGELPSFPKSVGKSCPGTDAPDGSACGA